MLLLFSTALSIDLGLFTEVVLQCKLHFSLQLVRLRSQSLRHLLFEFVDVHLILFDREISLRDLLRQLRACVTLLD